MTTPTSPPTPQAQRAIAVVQQIHQDVLAFMSQFNEIGDTHSQFLHQLIQHYVNNWVGLANDRVLISAHPGMGKTTCLRFFMRWLLLELLQGNMPGGAKKGLLAGLIESLFKWPIPT
ncbi:hypothetical protein [Synechococcus sp. CBW1107]|uniref:hypothetical protein n=1 Tax=Synechococcus sp. CBW1107 TaxID=2789857 RepID=UPI002AD56ABA|nr:hypothetical protein [Synechococcus sp. CBW1107]CAK6687298.1 hypothetical protein ICNINCKA_00175 [Synechococcus sp. CBW1107]